MNAARLHRRLAAAAALCALTAFISGAGFDAPLAIPAALLLLLAIVWQPAERAQRVIEPVLRVLALLLAGRAGLIALRGGVDVVAPMVDLLFLLLAAEALRASTRTGAVRLYALSFALLVAASAYRPGVFFGAAFVAFIVLLTVALVIGHIAGQAERLGGGARTPTVPARFVLSTALLSGVVLLTSAAVFISFPRVTRSWMARSETPARSVVGFSDVVSIGEHGAVIESNPEIVLRIEFPDGPPSNFGGLHWRGRSYNRFDGYRWHRSQLGPYAAPLDARLRDAPVVRQLVYARTLPTRPLFGLHRIVDVQPRSRIWPIREANGDVRYLGRVAPVYLVSSVIDRPGNAQLRAAPLRVPLTLTPYLQLPELTQRIYALADSLAVDAPTPYDRALRVQTFLRTEFAYTRELPRTAEAASLDHFLFERRAGHCEYFSTAMVVLLRALGVPARNVNGFLGGQWNGFGDYLAVSQNDAHSWVEVWFAGIGWVEFDPTPVGAAAGDAVARGAGPRWFAWLDGVEHRWNKWVLDYALEDQVELLRRVSDPFERVTGSESAAGDAAWPRLVPWLILLLTALAAGGLLLRRSTGGGASEPTRSYLSLRTAYMRAGLDAAGTPPRAFARRLHGAAAPGAEHAAAAVDLYLRGRFGARALTADERARLRQHVRAARAALRDAGAWTRLPRPLRS